MRSNIELLTRSTFWAIRAEAALPVVLQLTGIQAPGTWEAAKPSVSGKSGNKVAIIPIEGVLTNDGPAWLGSNYGTIATAAENALNDPNVKRVILSVDSPGGEVTGLPETVAVLANLAKAKPVSAIVEGTAASAAYWLTSQASDITLTPSGEVGSVGVRMMHADISAMLENAGVTITELYSGDFKTEWSPYKPLSEEAKTDMQPRLEAVHQSFIKDIATGRGTRVTPEVSQKRFGEGRMFDAPEARNHGLIDNVQSSRDFYRAVMPQPEEAQNAGFPIRARLELERTRF